nr:lipase member I-like [Onthophagus taurus]
MFLNALIEVKNQYLMRNDMNIFAIDWGSIAQGPCYPAAVYNSRIAGKCSALLIERLKELHVENIHVIGFSLGAHVSGFIANALFPYKLARITGLDPAMPGFATVPNSQKLDASDAEFVDVIHTNAFFQGQIQESGHVDFFVNGGVVQPGCWADNRFLACNHHRAPFYYAESINSENGFWAWPCTNYFSYLAGRCPPREPQIIMGDLTKKSATGMHLVITDSVSPFAVGKFTGPTIDIFKQNIETTRISDYERYKQMMIIGCTNNYNTGECDNNVVDSGDNLLYDIFP